MRNAKLKKVFAKRKPTFISNFEFRIKKSCIFVCFEVRFPIPKKEDDKVIFSQAKFSKENIHLRKKGFRSRTAHRGSPCKV